MVTPVFIFTIFLLTLGPIKTVPAFFAMTQDHAPADARSLALSGAAVATGVSLLIALVMTGVAASWRISRDDVRLAGGILLFLASCEVIGQFSRPTVSRQAVLPTRSAVSPLAIPTIISPWGVTAILFFADLAQGDSKLFTVVLGILLLVMLLNLTGMLLARPIISCVGMISFRVTGWIFAVLQAGLAVDAVVTSLRNLALFPPMP
jgi:multiple antibiotic resistance protein